MVLEALFYCFITVIAIQLTYYFGFLTYFPFHTSEHEASKKLAISVIICAKNEAENLKNNLPLILKQDYPHFEVILINDASSDDTLTILEFFKKKYNTIQIVDVKNVDRFWGNKKYALTLGIKASKNEYLLFTDADCRPNSNQWLAKMCSQFTEDKDIVLGYGGYEIIKSSLLNKLIRFETVLTAIQYFSYAKMGLPYMGVGRNMAYKKDVFFNNSGYVKHMNINSGDDDLLINEIATKENTAICISKDSFTISKPKIRFKDWINQKRRHVSTAKYYKFKHKALLALFYMSQSLFWILAIILIANGFQWQIVLGLILLRFAVQMTNLSKASKKLDETGLVILSPLLEVFLISSQFFIFIANLISKPKHWK